MADYSDCAKCGHSPSYHDSSKTTNVCIVHKCQCDGYVKAERGEKRDGTLLSILRSNARTKRTKGNLLL